MLLVSFTHDEERQVYKIKDQMAPRSDEELLQSAREYTSILLVRWTSNHSQLLHQCIAIFQRPPLARLISAYRDRVAGDKLNRQVKVAFVFFSELAYICI